MISGEFAAGYICAYVSIVFVMVLTILLFSKNKDGDSKCGANEDDGESKE